MNVFTLTSYCSALALGAAAAEGPSRVLHELSTATLPNGAEIGAFDPVSETIYVTSGGGLQLVDLSDPAHPVVSATILAGDAEITSTAVQPGSGVVAVAVVNGTDSTQPGAVRFYGADGTLLNTVTVGSLPDQIVFTADGNKLLVANEGESADPDENDPLILPNPEGSVSIIDLSDGVANATAVIADFNAFDSQADELRAAGVRLYPAVTSAEDAVDEDEDLTVSQDLEPEAIALSADGSTAFVTLQENNAVAVLDLANAEFTDILPLGLKDHSLAGAGLDASNRDSGIEIRNWPIFGMYMPDHIATYEVDGETYFVTANEGDGRDVDEERGADLFEDGLLDANLWSDGDLFADENLGRLKFSSVSGDSDGDGDIDVLHAFGARSFTIFKSNGEVVYDSGDDFERLTAALLPELFNSDESDPDEFDSRSDDKGPEPEGLTLGSVNGRTYAFVGLERTGGIMVYDITDLEKVCFVQYIRTEGDQAPEGLVFVSASDSPNGQPLLLVTNEVSNTLTTYEFDAERSFTLELFHLADQEAGAEAVHDAPRLSAILNKLRDEDLGDDGLADNTLTLSSGDAIIPGLFYSASEEVYGTAGIGDIQIQNELGIQAIALGNHEFDFGTDVLAALIDGSAKGNILDGDFAGARFPYLSGNLSFAADSAMAPLATADHAAPAANSVAATTVIEVNGEPIGVVGATTPTLASISSPGTLGIAPSPFGGTPSEGELDALAAEIQADVDALLMAQPAVNKVILLAHMQRIDIEQALATRLRDVDIIVAGGSNTRLFDENDRLRAGDNKQGDYPLWSTAADGKPIAVVNTDGSYKYLGRLVIDFDSAGALVPSSYDASISGAYATDEQGVSDLAAAEFTDPEVQRIADEIAANIIATDGNYFGITTEFLNGNRSGGPLDGVRTQETNLGNLTADANLMAAREVDPTVAFSLKNGGGIRASIGETVVLPGDTEATRRAPQANELSGRPEGGISENAIKTALAFNNGLRLMTLTKAEVLALLEHGVGALPSVSGRFPQVAGITFSYDESAPAGDRLISAALVDDAGDVVEILAAHGELAGDPEKTFRMVTLDFLSSPAFDDEGNHIGAGDGYPFPNINTDATRGAVANEEDLARIDQRIITTETQTGEATFADDYSEQDALAEYLTARFPETSPYEEVDVAREQDERIQNVALRLDDVLAGLSLATFAASYNVEPASDETILAYAYGLVPGQITELVLGEEGEVMTRGTESFQVEAAPNAVDLTLTFLRRKDASAQGLRYRVQTSPDLSEGSWEFVEGGLQVVGEDGEMEVVRVTLPYFTSQLDKARFFQVVVDTAE
ncbi:choice-of-anchor I family protein [Roseibacillus ishigakijimensis]|uniref:Choice-of-anchor I family protein n=1 Tax=Roseibacillus ishigakijimensis TaxID=454146 RepID=A0A934VNT9_9BACT|nr:choice-of-anchor I family protein [Roseibacillus ishigakijimensis]MBK1835411.1 choice-of-anchor I family protein [Roseibacillus ishigakijimensis]